MQPSRASPADMYHSVWQIVKDMFYDEARLADWALNEESTSNTEEDALRHATDLVDSLGDPYTRIIAPQEMQVKQERRESSEPAVTTSLLANDIGYLRIHRFNQLDVIEQVDRAVCTLSNARALIIDLRDNRGGLVNVAAQCCQFFMQQGVIATVEQRTAGTVQKRTIVLAEQALLTIQHAETEEDEVITGIERRPLHFANRPIAVLINGETASASELLAAALQENGAATVIGTESLGKGIAQDVVEIPHWQHKLKISCMRLYTPSDRWIGDAGQTLADGVKPDIVILGGAESSDDQQLLAAQHYLAKLLEAA